MAQSLSAALHLSGDCTCEPRDIGGSCDCGLSIFSPAVAVVHSTHRAATSLGYCVAPVVIAVNSEFRLSGGESHRKITIASWPRAFTEPQMTEIRDRLNDAENQYLVERWSGPASPPLALWGGNLKSGILGSPQGRSTELSVERILDAISGRV